MLPFSPPIPEKPQPRSRHARLTKICAILAYALDLGLGREMNSPHFEALGDNHKVTWKYRGQIPHRQQHMRLEVHIKRIEQSAAQITLIGDASLWREELRIYHVTDIGLAIVGS